MSMHIEVDSWDYSEAVRKVETLLANIHCTCDKNDIKNVPSGSEIVDIILDTII